MTDPDRQNINPWFAIWTRPRATMRWILDYETPTGIAAIVDSSPDRLVVPLAAIGGIAHALNRASTLGLGDLYPILGIAFWAVMGGALGGIITLFVGGWVLTLTGRPFRGTGSTEDVRSAVAWSNVPIIWALLLWIPELALFGREIFMSAMPLVEANPGLGLALLGFGALEIGVAVWAFVVFLKCLAEAQNFSAWRALGSTVLAGLIPIAIGVATAIAIDTPPIARGDGFTVRVPDGLRQLTAHELAGAPLPVDAVVLLQQARLSPSAFRASVIVHEEDSLHTDEFNPANRLQCEALGAQVSGEPGAKLSDVDMVDTVLGRACRIWMTSRTDNHASMLTAVVQDNRVWTFTCSHDVRDQMFLSACEAVLASFRIASMDES